MRGNERNGNKNSTFYLCLGTFPLEPAGFFATRQSQFAWVCQQLCTKPTEYDSQNQCYVKSDEKSHSDAPQSKTFSQHTTPVLFSKEKVSKRKSVVSMILQIAHRRYWFDLLRTEIPHGLSTMTNAGVWIFIWHSFHSILIKEEDWERQGLFASG